MAAYLDILEFIALLLRAVSFAALTLAAGGALFLVLVGRDVPEIGFRIRRWTVRFSIVLACIEAARSSLNSAILYGTTGATLPELLGANYSVASMITIAASVAVLLLMKKPTPKPWMVLSAVTSLLIGLVMTSHSAARLEKSGVLSVMTALHLAGTAIWMGGLPYLLLSIKHGDEKIGLDLVRRFSKIAIIGVLAITGSGIILSLAYIDSWSALYGTAYGYMVCTKVVLFGITLLLGAVNNKLVNRLPQQALGVLRRISTVGEAEIGIGFTVILAAASLTSQPPATDLRTDRLTLSEISDRMRPETPRLKSPPVGDLTPASVDSQSVQFAPPPANNNESDIEWSEYNHHWAGIIVGSLGFFALFSRGRASPIARHWPLLFVGLAVFIVLRADPENWPLGPKSFWGSFRVAEVAQHRFYAVLIVLFAIFEWRVQTGRVKSQWQAGIFPFMCAIGGALLLTHNHSLGNVKESLLAEMSHTPIAVAGATAGWARWLEVRLPNAPVFLRWIWPTCLMAVGVILLFYREA